MANEIQINVALQLTKGLLQYSQNPGSVLFDMAGTRAAGGAQTASVSATAVAIDIGLLSATTVGWAYFRNTSSTVGESILIGTGTGTFVPFMQLKPREVALLRISSDTSGVTPTFRSIAGTPVLQYWIAEN
jgi:hypothetical protein